MSWKIYNAYRVVAPEVLLWPLVSDIRRDAERRVKLAMAARYKVWTDKDATPEVPKSEAYKLADAAACAQMRADPRDFGPVMDFMREFEHEMDFTRGEVNAIRKSEKVPEDRRLSYIDCSHYVQRRYRECAGSLERDSADMDVSVSLYIFEGRFYLRKILGDSRMVEHALDILDEDPRFAEYHFQTSSDRPEKVSEEDWEERRRVWEAIFGDSNIATNPILSAWVSVPIVTPHLLVQIDPWLDMSRADRKMIERMHAEAETDVTL